MRPYWNSVQNVLIDRTPAELIGAILVCLVLALAVTGLYQWGIRKIRDGVMLMTALVVPACLVAMALAGGFVERSRRAGVYGFATSAPVAVRRVPRDIVLEVRLARRLLTLADRDHDGSLSAEEAAEFAREAERKEQRPLVADALAEALRTDAVPPHASDRLSRPWSPHPLDPPRDRERATDDDK